MLRKEEFLLLVEVDEEGALLTSRLASFRWISNDRCFSSVSIVDLIKPVREEPPQ